MRERKKKGAREVRAIETESVALYFFLRGVELLHEHLEVHLRWAREVDAEL